MGQSVIYKHFRQAVWLVLIIHSAVADRRRSLLVYFWPVHSCITLSGSILELLLETSSNKGWRLDKYFPRHTIKMDMLKTQTNKSLKPLKLCLWSRNVFIPKYYGALWLNPRLIRSHMVTPDFTTCYTQMKNGRVITAGNYLRTIVAHILIE